MLKQVVTFATIRQRSDIQRRHPLLALCILCPILVKVGLVLVGKIILAVGPHDEPTRTIPEMERLTVHTVRRRHHLEQIPPRNLNRRDLRRG